MLFDGPREKIWYYHDIVKDDMRNGNGLRVTIFLAGCNHYCQGCHNPETWDPTNGILFDEAAYNEAIEAVDHDYIQGVTLSGGDPFHPANRYATNLFVQDFRKRFHTKKDIWIYTGYTWEQLHDKNSPDYDALNTLASIDVLVDGPFKKELADVNYHWAGSTNQRVISVPKSDDHNIVLYEDEKKGIFQGKLLSGRFNFTSPLVIPPSTEIEEKTFNPEDVFTELERRGWKESMLKHK